MKTVFLLFDSLCRQALECYGGTAVKTPNFNRLAARGVCFDNHYVGSMPCMPARRDMHTGRLNFLHRSWGPLEPFDDSYAHVLGEHGVYSHLVTDHYHYFEDGGVCYNQRFSSYEFVRGQEKDRWKPLVDLPMDRWRQQYHGLQVDEFRNENSKLINYTNREFLRDEEDYPIARNFKHAFEFLELNRNSDDWLLQIECYDPHEPFTAPERFRKDYPTGYEGPILDCPRYDRLTDESPDEVAELRANYAALVAMCDDYVGRLLDYFDRNDMWKDTAIVVTSDHGFLIGEHDWFGKNRMPFFNEICNTPLIVCHPDFADRGGEHRQALTQSIDIMPTLLGLYGIEPPADVQGQSLLGVLDRDQAVRETCLYGMFGAAVNITDGRYTYFRYPRDMQNAELFEHTLMPTHLRSRFGVHEFEGTRFAGPFTFTKGAEVMRIPSRMGSKDGLLKGATIEDTQDVLFDLAADPGQENPIVDEAVEMRLIGQMSDLMQKADAPGEAFRRLGLKVPSQISVPGDNPEKAA